MPAHIRSTLTQTQLSIPVQENKPRLGIWQGLYLFEHRTHPHKREIILHLIGE
jgi:secondary thiamine-phosphate synthase enzyme